MKAARGRDGYVSFESKGHAMYAQEGRDIVCAAVSALIINTVNSLEKFTEDDFEAEAEDGFVRIRFHGRQSEGGRLLMDSLLLGLETIGQDYNHRYLKIMIREV